MKTEIITTLTIEGVHRWLGANHQEYSYLKSMHRHEFEIEARKRVQHNDRDIEIIQLSHYIKEYFNPFWSGSYKCYNLGDLSCEMIAHQLVAAFGLESCTVREDGKMGAHVQMEEVEVVAICGPCNSGKSTLVEQWYQGWQIIEVSKIVKTRLEQEGSNLFGEQNKRVLRPDLAHDIAYAIRVEINIESFNRVAIVGIRQPEIIKRLSEHLTSVVMLTEQYGEYDHEGAAIDEKLGVHNIKPTVTLKQTVWKN